MTRKNDVMMDTLNVALEAGTFSQITAEYLNNLLPDDLKYIMDAVTCTASISNLAILEAREIYRGREATSQTEDRIRELYEQLNEWRDRFGVLKGKREAEHSENKPIKEVKYE